MRDLMDLLDTRHDLAEVLDHALHRFGLVTLKAGDHTGEVTPILVQ